MTSRLKIVSEKILSDFWGTTRGYEVEYTREDGTVQHLKREAYDHGHAAAVLPHDPARDTVILVRQFRFAAHVAGGPDMLVEVVAGLLDGDEPEACARRETEEEAGVTLVACDPAFTIFVSPGSITEKIHCFVGTYSSPVTHHRGLGLAHEGEEIEVLELRLDEALGMIRRGEIVDAKTIVLLQHLALARTS